MHSETSILIQAPLADVFSAASDLKGWPDYLPHYKENLFLSQMPWGGIVKMHCKRTGLNLKWISVFIIDTENCQLRFEHLSKWTRGMQVVWNFQQQGNAVLVSIQHDHQSTIPVVGGLISDWIVGKFSIDYIAPRTLAGLKKRLERV
jgi:ribosome-associated toxin RatA of RatAB toxin-antitoxin module